MDRVPPSPLPPKIPRGNQAVASTSSGSKDFVCAYCKSSYASGSSLRGHISSKHKDTHSAYKKLDKEELATAEAGPLMFLDPDSGERTTSPPPWVSDSYRALEEGQKQNGCGYSCGQCVYLGASEEEIVWHVMLIHRPEAPKVCQYCDKTFKSGSSLRGHISSRHRDEHAEAKAKKRTAAEAGIDGGGFSGETE